MNEVTQSRFFKLSRKIPDAPYMEQYLSSVCDAIQFTILMGFFHIRPNIPHWYIQILRHFDFSAKNGCYLAAKRISHAFVLIAKHSKHLNQNTDQ